MITEQSRHLVSNPASLSGLCHSSAGHILLSVTAGARDSSKCAPVVLTWGYRSLTYTFLPLCLSLRKQDDRSLRTRRRRVGVFLQHGKALLQLGERAVNRW